ncbi:hypothetical protein CAPTEDRAFT_18019 [Capitella teleta]|uniref:phosphatidylinositol 3-kinase n=1 Tax=Capitella teleta TaxID=283909 RepID=R7VIY3_CAPTE|nr:hypothetical protein CAPTEDRAFT_18019 [Capitella teleta]|eukprot:ELU18517.1 hypothetical protein CAPTEDRAFT_18019 [Capitella teleta]
MVAQALNQLWSEDDECPLLLDCLLPTGIIIPLATSKHARIDEIKEMIWKEAPKYPLYSLLKDKNTYVLMCIDEMASKVELEDESQRLSEVRPFHPMVKVIEKKGNRAEKVINAQISILLGKGLREFDSLKSSEVSDFRRNMRVMTDRVAKERDSQPWLQRMKCLYPPDLASSSEMPAQIMDRIIDNFFRVVVHLDNETGVYYTFRIHCNSLPSDLVQMAIDKREKTTGIQLDSVENYILKVIGCEEFLIGDYPLSQFMYLRQKVSKGETPTFLLLSKHGVNEGDPPIVRPRGLSHRAHNTAPPPPPRPIRGGATSQRKPSQSSEKAKGHMLWEQKDMYKVTIQEVTNLTIVPEYSKIQVRSGIYHGDTGMCAVNTTKDCMVTEGVVTWNETITFELSIADIPRMARLCFLVESVAEKRKARQNTSGGRTGRVGRQEVNSLAWVNIPIFDYKGVLRTGPQVMYMWSITDDDILSEELLNPLGTVEQNPLTKYAVCINCIFENYNLDGPIYFPPFDTMNVDAVNKEKHLEQLRVMIARDPLHQLHEQDKELIWLLKYECQYHFPESLPKLVNSVQWNNHFSTAQMHALLQIWQTLEPEQALELLDCQYADKAVRSYAVKCLMKMSDRQLCQYLLQLVQVLKYELYLECDLVEFLLNRALNNQKIGHNFFWLLRSEMHVPSVSVRFGLILEAYCRGSQNHLRSLSRQVEALSRMASINQNIKNYKGARDKGRDRLQSVISQDSNMKAFSDIQSALNPSFKMKKPVVEQCTYMDSKMRPLKLVFENVDAGGQDIVIMYKQGDDLRKDMLTLQILRIMDNIWQEDGLDLRINPYQCLSTGQDEGLIDIVTLSTTLANIQKQHGLKLKSAFNKQCIYDWLRKYNPTDEKMEAAIEEFTLSCAGYCVATYVLGVADRHSDNIMVRQNGQLFHIDFGHILGHFKFKFGIKRERVPFVLTNDFVYVVQRGAENKNEEFKKFRDLCLQAFMALRSKSNFLISLFMMMMNTGIDELSSLKDVEYLKETLVPDLSEKDAKSHFLSKFQESLKNSWKTSMNNTFHNITRENN